MRFKTATGEAHSNAPAAQPRPNGLLVSSAILAAVHGVDGAFRDISSRREQWPPALWENVADMENGGATAAPGGD
jgi:hypothetical protein